MSNIKAVFNQDITTVWATVTSLIDYTWRSDISKIDVMDDGKTFIEYTNDGCATTFTITAFEPMKRYEFDMENKNMQGHWIGCFSVIHGQTIIDFTEDVQVKKLWMKLFVKAYLRKQQATYISDLELFLANMR